MPIGNGRRETSGTHLGARQPTDGSRKKASKTRPRIRPMPFSDRPSVSILPSSISPDTMGPSARIESRDLPFVLGLASRSLADSRRGGWWAVQPSSFVHAPHPARRDRRSRRSRWGTPRSLPRWEGFPTSSAFWQRHKFAVDQHFMTFEDGLRDSYRNASFLVLLCYKRWIPQKRHRQSLRSKERARMMRRVAMEWRLCLSGRMRASCLVAGREFGR